MSLIRAILVEIPRWLLCIVLIVLVLLIIILLVQLLTGSRIDTPWGPFQIIGKGKPGGGWVEVVDDGKDFDPQCAYQWQKLSDPETIYNAAMVRKDILTLDISNGNVILVKKERKDRMVVDPDKPGSEARIYSIRLLRKCE